MLPPLSNPALAKTAFTHRSALNEMDDAVISNERLEFLGDAVLELATSVYLFEKLPDAPEGELTTFRSSLVKTSTLARVARMLLLGDQIIMSKGEEGSKGRENEAILADTFEAYLGALYIDQGYDAVNLFLQQTLFPLLEEIKENNLQKDSKSALQEFIQQTRKKLPQYTVLQASGPDHSRQFTIAVLVDGKELARATGKSKQEAQQDAAKKALEVLRTA
jgi:ribonuclease-3